MTERRRPPRRGRGARPSGETAPDTNIEADPYRDASDPVESPVAEAPAPVARFERSEPDEPPAQRADPSSNGELRAEGESGESGGPEGVGELGAQNDSPNGQRPFPDGTDRPERNGRGRRGRRQRGRGRGPDRPDRGEQPRAEPRGEPRGEPRSERPDRGPRGPRGARHDRGGERGPDRGDSREQSGAPPVILVVDGETSGWFDPARDAGFIRRAEFSYLNEPNDTFVPPHLVREFGLRRGDALEARTGRDQRGRLCVAEFVAINGTEPDPTLKRTDFQTLTASYPERKLTLETGRPAKSGPELTRRAIDLIAPIGYGQRALIVAPARAGKTMLMQAITEGIAINHPEATLLILLVDERPEEVSEAISWGVGEVVASSFDQPAKRHVEVVEMVLERARRLVEHGKDVVIVLDSLTRMARAFNTAERGTGRTLSGGLDTSAMARPKAFFGSARYILPQHGGGSLTIIATALVETGSRMDDVIFEEFKGTGNCEIKLDRSLSEKRIFPAFDIATSGTRREEKLYKAEQIDAIYTLRRGLQQMPPQAAMEWLIKRIAGTTSNDALLAGL